jgi:hypothetical protein
MNKENEASLVPIRTLQPSQLYISEDKLTRVQLSIDFSIPDHIPPVPIKDLSGDRVLTDGHTRAYAAYLAGMEEIPVFQDRDELDWQAYRICVGWCKAAGITTIAHLNGRVISPEAYQQLWVDRCEAMHKKLAQDRESTKLSR